VGDQPDDTAGCPADFVGRTWRLGDIDIEPEEASINVKSTIGRPADPFR
jgi:hypothetical protein